MSHKPLIVVIEGAGSYDASLTLAHLAPRAAEIRIRCLDHPDALDQVSETSLVIAASPLDGHHTLSPAEVLKLDPKTVVELAKRSSPQIGGLQSKHQWSLNQWSLNQQSKHQQSNHQATVGPATTLTQSVSNRSACVESDDLGGQAELSLDLDLPATPVISPDAPMDRQSRGVDAALGVEHSKEEQLAHHLSAADRLYALDATVNSEPTATESDFGCLVIPVLGIDPGLSAQVSCVLAQIAAESGATVLMELDRHGFQRFLHDLPTDTPSLDAFTSSATNQSIIDFSIPVTSRGYHLLPRLPRNHLTREVEPDDIEAMLERLALSRVSIVAALDAVLATSQPSQQTDAADLVAESLLRHSKVMVFVSASGLVPTFALVNLIRETLRRFINPVEILIIITGNRDELRRGRDLHQLLNAAIPESIAKVATLEIVTLGGLTLDEFHDRVLPFPNSVLRALRPFGRRAAQLPPTIPHLHAQAITHPYYEKIDPLLNFFSKVSD